MVKKIKLTQGQYATVDDEDYRWLNQWKWYAQWIPGSKSYYAARSVFVGIINGKRKNKVIYMHRLILGAKNEETVDHINHNTLKNTRKNLRLCSIRQNSQNRRKKGTSKYPGVSWNPQRKMWQARIQINGKEENLGFFDIERLAAKRYEEKCRELGEELICKMEKEKV